MTEQISYTDVLVVIAAGINTNKEDDLFRDLKKELKKRYQKEGKTVQFLEIYPLGEVKDNPVGKQVLRVGMNMQRGTGGKDISDAVIRCLKYAAQFVLIGHSGGGQAVGDALPVLEGKGINISHAVQIGAPVQLIDKKYIDKITRVQTKSDFVSNFVSSGAEAVSHGINPLGGLISGFLSMFTRKMPKIIYADINTDGQPFGGHSAYFSRNLINSKGTDNVTSTVEAFWDRIK